MLKDDTNSYIVLQELPEALYRPKILIGLFNDLPLGQDFCWSDEFRHFLGDA